MEGQHVSSEASGQVERSTDQKTGAGALAGWTEDPSVAEDLVVADLVPAESLVVAALVDLAALP